MLIKLDRTGMQPVCIFNILINYGLHKFSHVMANVLRAKQTGCLHIFISFFPIFQ